MFDSNHYTKIDYKNKCETIATLEAENVALRDFIARRGYVSCDIPACNCGSFHRGHAEARLTEIYEVLGGCNGTTPVPEIERMQAHNTRLEEALEALLPFALIGRRMKRDGLSGGEVVWEGLNPMQTICVSAFYSAGDAWNEYRATLEQPE